MPTLRFCSKKSVKWSNGPFVVTISNRLLNFVHCTLPHSRLSFYATSSERKTVIIFYMDLYKHRMKLCSTAFAIAIGCYSVENSIILLVQPTLFVNTLKGVALKPVPSNPEFMILHHYGKYTPICLSHSQERN